MAQPNFLTVQRRQVYLKAKLTLILQVKFVTMSLTMLEESSGISTRIADRLGAPGVARMGSDTNGGSLGLPTGSCKA